MWLDPIDLEEVAPGCCPLVVPYSNSCLTSKISRPHLPCTVVAVRQVFLEFSRLDCMHSGQFEVWTL